ncbi:MAG TPA: hypothetical protein RMH99_02230 [Sandaracinaceae bacterium LLY-WYZ-13_1]|nr:hypothetical protein [Sandaracinaceae bacterium LLY-WYZ-13_1]
MTVVIGDFWNAWAAGRRPRTVLPSDYADYVFSPHHPNDTGIEWALRAADRMELTEALRRSLGAIYEHRIELARRDGVTVHTQDTLRHEGELIREAVRGFFPRGTRYELVVRGCRGEPGAPRLASTFGWEFRRLREAIEHHRDVALGFDRPPPRHGRHRYHYRSSRDRGLLDLDERDGATPWNRSSGPHAPVRCIIAGSLQQPQMPMTRRGYFEGLGYVLLHELLGHGVARLRGTREPHRLDPRNRFTRGDRVAAWLAQALEEPANAEVPHVRVPWNWDPDAGPEERAPAISR